MSAPLVNGTRHAWASIDVNMLGRTVSGISSVEYEDSQEKVDNHGAGIYPVSRGLGKYEAKAKLSLHAYEINAIQAALGAGQRLTDIAPFNIVVSYKPTGSDLLITHVIRNCEFKSNKRAIKSGDTNIETDFDLIVSHIDWQ